MQQMIKIFDILWSLNCKGKAYKLWFKWKNNLLGREQSSPSQEIWALILLCVPNFSRLMSRKWWMITLLQSIQLPLRIRIDTGYLTLNIHWKDRCWNWSSNTLSTWWEELTHWKKTLMLGKTEGKWRGLYRMRCLAGTTDSMGIRWANSRR